MSELRSIWAALGVEARTEPGWHVRRVRGGSPCDIRAAVAAPGGAVALLFEVRARSVPAGAAMPDCIGFTLTPEIITAGPGGQLRLCLSLRDARYQPVFETLAEDVADAVAVAPSEAAGVKALLARLRTWERFVQRFGHDHLSEEQQLGLHAELLCLERHLLPLMDAGVAVRGWRGPHGEPQDFRFRAAAVEVKATAAANPQSFRVANLDQLDPGARDLLLVHHIGFAVGSTGRTLPEVVAGLRAALDTSDPVAAADLETALTEAGYLDLHEAAYAERRRSVRTATWFRVADGFPRLTSCTVPPGVAAARYDVLLQSCSGCAISEGTALQLLREGI